MRFLALAFLLISNLTFAQSKFALHKDLAPYLKETESAKFNLVETPFDTEVFYDSTFNQNLFGYLPKEVLISDLMPSGHTIQINYEYDPMNEDNRGFGPTMRIIKELESVFGDAHSAVWGSNEINLKWNLQNISVSLKHLELHQARTIVVRLDIMSNRLLSQK